jgi:hypothetical protein
VNWGEVAVAALAAITWITLFTIGYTVHAGPFQEILKEPPGLLIFVGAIVMFTLASVPTNVLLLALVAGALGTAYRRAKGMLSHGHRLTKAQDYMFAVTSSFFVYVCLLAGLMTLTVADALTAETAEKQIQLAATASLCAFLVGYDRKLLGWMLRRAARFFTTFDGQQRGESAGTRPPQPAPAPNGAAVPPEPAALSATGNGKARASTSSAAATIQGAATSATTTTTASSPAGQASST